MRVQALLVAVFASGASIVLVELTRVPFENREQALAFALLLRCATSSFAVPALLAGLAAATLAVKGDERVRWVLLVGLGITEVALAREGLIEYGPFARSTPLNLAFIALGIGVAGLHLRLREPTPWSGALGAGVLLLSLSIVRLHYHVYVGLYPTLHHCVLQLAFIGATLGIALLIASHRRSSLMAFIALGVGATVLVVALVRLPAAGALRSLVTAHTELGRSVFVAEALERDRDDLLPRRLPSPGRAARFSPDDDALARFETNAGLPNLDFDLESHDVLLVLTDATRFDRTSLADPERDTTPRLARLAARGAHVFTHAYSPSNGTFPSLASMLAMTPVSFAELDIFPRPWRGRLRAGRTTATELLRASGRRTFWVGHDHQNCFSQHIHGLERGFDERVLIEEIRGDPSDIDVDTDIADEGVRQISRTPGRFFGLVFFVSPHDDYRGGYDAELRRFDAALARLLLAVDLSQTIVIVAGDHGEAFSEHGHQHHLSSVYDEQIHVPLVIWVPGAPGAVHMPPTSTSYVLPWLLLRGTEAQRAGAQTVLREDIGPLMRELDGAVVSEMIGPRRQHVALMWQHTTVVYDVLADLPRIFDAADDPGQRHDLREQDPARFERMVPFVERYRRARYDGRRFRFVVED